MAITDTPQLNNLIFSKGSIQVSPQHLQILNMQPPKLFNPSGHRPVTNAGYRVFLSGYAEYVVSSEVNNYAQYSLENLINQLRANPRSVKNSFQMKGTVDTRKLSTGRYDIWYKIHSGQILVFNVELQDEAQKARDRLEKPGLYKITKNAQGNWVKSFAATKIITDYAAVNGQSNNLNKATWLMGAHLDFEYGKTNLKEYTLFHNPSEGGMSDTWESLRDKLGFTTDVTRNFSKVLQDSQKAGKEIKWVAHSQGGAIFAEGVRYYLNGNSSWAILGGFNGIFKDKEEVSLNQHKVAFHGNANNNMRSKLLFERAGIEVVATRVNDYDFVGNVLGFNTLNPRKLIGSTVYANHVFSGSVAQSPHTLAQTQEQWAKNMTSGPGKGRNAIQQGFEAVNGAVQSTVRYINNFLK